MLIAQQQQEQNEISLENQRVIDNINAAQSQDTSSSDNGGSSSGSGEGGSSSDSNNNQDDEVVHRDNQLQTIGSESHFIVMSEAGGIGLNKIISDESALDTNILPKTIQPIKSFDSLGEALAWLGNYDDNH